MMSFNILKAIIILDYLFATRDFNSIRTNSKEIIKKKTMTFSQLHDSLINFSIKTDPTNYIRANECFFFYMRIY